MITFTPDGTKALVANEGEPSDDYTNDPEGTVTVIDVSSVVLTDSSTFNSMTATQVGFGAFNA